MTPKVTFATRVANSELLNMPVWREAPFKVLTTRFIQRGARARSDSEDTFGSAFWVIRISARFHHHRRKRASAKIWPAFVSCGQLTVVIPWSGQLMLPVVAVVAVV
jgi:hypothetical protein